MEVTHSIDRSINQWIDLQVNGYVGVDFNSPAAFADPVSVQRLIDTLVSSCIGGFLPTVITDEVGKMVDRIGAIAGVIESNQQLGDLVRGIHVEGPFLNPNDGYIGAHPTEHAKPASIEIAKRLLDAGRGHVRMVTLAPEQDDDAKLTQWLNDANVLVAAGHTDATLDQLDRCLDSGLSLFTHLGNGCPAMLPRHDNIISRVLSRADRLSISLIADGHHIPWFALRNYLSLIPDDRIIIVSDAIAAAGLPAGTYALGNQTVTVDEDGAAWSADRKHFAGSATTMPEMAKLLDANLDISPDRLRKWFVQNPLNLLG